MHATPENDRISIVKKLRLYIDTSVLGGIFDSEEPKRVNTAERLPHTIPREIKAINGVYFDF